MEPGIMNRSSQLKWIILLAVAVVLPTVCLLWFMSRVVANERLVIQQKLATVYGRQLEEAGEQVKRRINDRFDAFSNENWALNPYGLLSRLVKGEHFQGVVLWDAEGRMVYPSAVPPPDSEDLSSGPLAEAWQLEFAVQDYEAALERYEQLADAADPRALAGQVRCLIRLGRWGDALENALQPERPSAASARLLLLSKLQKTPELPDAQAMISKVVKGLESDLFKRGEDHLPTQQNLLIARRFLEVREAQGKSEGPLGELVEAESLSLALAASRPKPTGPVDTMVPISLKGELFYQIRHPTPIFGEMLILLSNEGLASALDGYRIEFEDSDAQCRILDVRGNVIAGDPGEGMPTIASSPLPTGFPDGLVELYLPGWSYFQKAAGRQIAVYIWTGVLVIMLMIVVGAFAVLAVGRQIRLNRMKNDFIATVSHELKTPLASMRLLVDTLLEGRTRDEAHAEEYLKMIARENERLTRMIENFLSFSRMERNKNAFTMAAASPAAIAEDAADSVCMKYRTNRCRLETDIADDLPEIPVDHDAIVTVLINLLENACKYTTDDKRIRLSLFAESGEICFAVSDNGIGMSKRQLRRIFDSFYQVDASLARAVEGCGLGLSIVQFIVNAHKGHIEVDSQPGQGSTFTVRLPMNRKNGGQGNHADSADC